MLWFGHCGIKSSTINTTLIIHPMERRSGLQKFVSLPHLKLVVNSMILLPVKVGQDDLQLVISSAGQAVELVQAKPALS